MQCEEYSFTLTQSTLECVSKLVTGSKAVKVTSRDILPLYCFPSTELS